MTKKLLNPLRLFVFLAGCWTCGASAQIRWQDKTSLITNPSFETDEAIANLTTAGWDVNRVSGWTIAPGNPANSQVGIANGSSTLSVLSGTNASDENNYYYVRCNWNKDVNFTLSQTIDARDLPKGLYRLTCKIATFSSSASVSKWTLALQENGKDAVTNTNAGSLGRWMDYGVILYKESDETTLTISATMFPGADGPGANYAMLLDDFQLSYISEADYFAVSPENPIDMSGVLYNAGIYNENDEKELPRGWQEYDRSAGNNNRTEKTGDTQLEGWSGGALRVDYYQTVSGLPIGTYTLTAWCHDRDGVGAYNYIYNTTTLERETCIMSTGDNYADITTGALAVWAGENVNAGIKCESNRGTWCTGDNFRLKLVSCIDAYKHRLESIKQTAQGYLDSYTNITGEERESLTSVLNEKVTEETVPAYVTALDQLQAVMNDFVSVKSVYDEYANEKETAVRLGTNISEVGEPTTAATAEEIAHKINVLNYQEVEAAGYFDVSASVLGEWTDNNVGSRNKQHYSGNENDTYFEMDAGWGDASWTMSRKQSINLAVGKYVFRVAARASEQADAKITVTIGETSLSTYAGHHGDTGYGITTSGEASYDPNQTYALDDNGQNTGRGFEWKYIPFHVTSDNEAVTLSFEAEGKALHQYVSFTSLGIFTDETTSVRSELLTEINNAEKITTEKPNIGKEAFQIPESALTTLQSKLVEAKNLYDSNSLKIDELKSAKEDLQAEMTTLYNNVALNAPAANTLYGIVNNSIRTNSYNGDNQYATIRHDRTDGQGEFNIGWQNENELRGQGFTFEAVDGGLNYYRIAFEDEKGKTFYLCTAANANGSGEAGIRTTADSDKALAFQVIVTQTNGVYNLLNTAANAYVGAQDDGFYTVNSNNNLHMAVVNKKSIQFVVSEADWATLMLPFAAKVPDGMTVYSYSATTSTDDRTSISLRAENTIAANTPYIVQGEGNYPFEGYGKAWLDEYTDAVGVLTGSFVDGKGVPQNSYVLQNQEGEVAFYVVQTNDITVGAYHAYLTLPADDIDLNVRVLQLPGSETTGMAEAVAAEPDAVLDVYTLSGVLVKKGVKRSQALDGMQKGIYIVGGKKVVK